MIHFSRYIKIYVLISALVIVPGIYSLLRFGLRPSIDFTGGSLLQYKFEKNIDQKLIEETAGEQQVEIFSIQKTKDNSMLLRTNSINQDKASMFKLSLEEKSKAKVTEIRFETIGPILGKELMQKTITAMVIAILAILLYIGWSFKNITWGIAAILALIHDLLVLIGSFSLFGHFFGVEVDSLFVTAVLTTTSFSVHDTIVVCHRIIEIQKNQPRLNLRDAVDLAITETMVRSLNNSLTIIFMLFVLVLLGGTTVRWFATALLIGTVTGTYSSPFVATPILLLLQKLKERGRK